MGAAETTVTKEISEGTSIPLKMVIGLLTLVVAGIGSWYSQKARVDSLEDRMKHVEFVVCRIEGKLVPNAFDPDCVLVVKETSGP